jgi:GNAT superfamily N-acetyltransferase
MEGKVLCLDAGHVPECAKVMAQAFADSPAYKFIFQGPLDYRKEALEWLFVKNIALVLSKCPTALRGFVDPYGRVLCCFLWVPGQVAKVSTWEMVTAGMWALPFRYGISTMLRLSSLLDAMKTPAMGNIASDRSPNKTIMLQRMVVHPDYQGNGIGTTALNAVLKDLDIGQDVYLDTQEERNVVFYQRLGWHVEHERDYFPEDPNFGFHSWSLVRKTPSKE